MSHNCPNCGAPVTSYICEYCGTVLKKPDKTAKVLDKICELELERKEKAVQDLSRLVVQTSQELQTQCLLDQLNYYGIDTQIRNMRDSINVGMASQVCNIQQSMLNTYVQTQANIYTCSHDIYQEVHERDVTAITAKEEESSSGRDYSKLILVLVVFIFIIIEAFFLIQFFESL